MTAPPSFSMFVFALLSSWTSLRMTSAYSIPKAAATTTTTSTVIPSSKTRLFYIDESTKQTEDVLAPYVPLPLSAPQEQQQEQRVWIESMAFAMDISDSHLQEAFANWCLQHNKPESKYNAVQFQYNYLQLEIWNRAHGTFLTLNEYGDCPSSPEALTVELVTEQHESQSSASIHYWETLPAVSATLTSSQPSPPPPRCRSWSRQSLLSVPNRD